MANMNHCQACRQHYYLHERACPHCGTAAPGGRVGRYVRRAKLGGLMLFTALTTTACYGAPPPPGTQPKGKGTVIEQPLSKVPTTAGTAYVFVTPKGVGKQGSTLTLATAVLEGGVLSFKEGAPGGGAVTDTALSIVIEAADPQAFQPPAKDAAFPALPVEKMKRLEVSAKYTNAQGRKVNAEVKSPTEAGIQGTLQLSQMDSVSVGGVLQVDKADMLIEVYFLAAR